jgi:hypothetical protein
VAGAGSGSGPELDELVHALDGEDPDRFERAVDGLAAAIGRADPDPATATALDALGRLRRRRRFPAALRVAEAAIRAGSENPSVSRHYAQALIEEGLPSAALAILDPLRQHPGSEAAEIDGLIGRAHKQRYVQSPSGASAERDLRGAIGAYLGRYLADRQENLWHGINAVAMLARAERDGRAAARDPDWRALADELLATIGARAEDDGARPWDAAIAAEAHVARGDFRSAAGWLASFAGQAEDDAFAFAATLRQLREVWQIDEAVTVQRALIDLLEARLLRAGGGRLDVDATRRAEQLDDAAEYLEAVLGEDEYKTIQWYRAGLEAARSVVRINLAMGITVGTGFVLPGGALHPSWAGRSVVLTNFHVANRGAVQPGRAAADLRVVFEDNGVEVGIREILWESPAVAVGTNPPASLDAAVLVLEPDSLPAPSYQLAPGPPAVGKRVYVIGYPRGQALAFSLQDNKTLAVAASVIHYRAPTRPGSSGSPVFDEAWRVVGLHHGGAPSLACLDNPDATYAANEGMLLSAIRQLVATQLA